MKSKSGIRVTVTDDHFIVRSGLIASINEEADLSVVADAATGAQSIDIYGQYKPDVALIDLRLPDMSGIEIVKAIRAKFSDAHLIVLSAYDGDEDIYRALEAGAMAYVLKSALRDELLQAIRTVAGGKRFIPANVAVRLAERAPRPQLREREIQVLQLIAEGKSNKEIGCALELSEATVKLHVGNILTKLSVNDRTQAVTSALHRGLLHLD